MSDRVRLGLLAASLAMAGVLVFALSRAADQAELAQLVERQTALQEELRETQEDVRVANLCVLFQLGAHRVNAHAESVAEARAEGREPVMPAPPPTSPLVDAAACDRFFADLAEGPPATP